MMTDPLKDNYIKRHTGLNGWLVDFTFWKFILTFIVFSAINVTIFYMTVKNHIDDTRIHLSAKQGFILETIDNTGLSQGAYAKIIELDREIAKLKLQIQINNEETARKTREETIALIKEAINQYNLRKVK